MDEGMTNYTEYKVVKKATGREKLNRFLLVLVWWLIPLVVIVLALSVKALAWMLWLTPVVVMLVIPFGRHTYKMTFIEYEYALVSGAMRFDIINGAAKRHEWFEARLSDMTLLAPYEGQYKEQADKVDAKYRYVAISSYDSPDIYCGVYKNEDGEQCVVIFEATNKFINLAKFYNRNTVIKQVRF